MSAPHTIDLLSVANFAGSQPHDQFDWLRQNSPVHRHELPGGEPFWAVTRYDDVKTVGRDAATYSSSPTVMLHDSQSGGADPFGDHTMMLMADPPVHTRMRRLVSKEFTPRAAMALGPRIDQLAERIIDEVIERGECDLVPDLAGEMPSFVIAEMLGIPHDDGRTLYQHTEVLHSSDEVVSADDSAAALGAMFEYSQQVYADRMAHPSDDLASLIAHGVIDDEPVDSVDFFLWFLLLIDAGGDTTRNLVGAGMHALFEHPAELARLQADPEALLPTAIEELLRWVSPVIYMRRTATAATELAGQAIAAGDKVVMYYGAANRDPSVFAEPDRLDIRRAHNPHVAFGGGGPHYCLGSHLARLEIRALLGAMLRRLEDLAPSGAPTWMGSNFIFGPTSLPVTFRASGRSVTG